MMLFIFLQWFNSQKSDLDRVRREMNLIDWRGIVTDQIRYPTPHQFRFSLDQLHLDPPRIRQILSCLQNMPIIVILCNWCKVRQVNNRRYESIKKHNDQPYFN
jgi:hypothetical protein